MILEELITTSVVEMTTNLTPFPSTSTMNSCMLLLPLHWLLGLSNLDNVGLWESRDVVDRLYKHEMVE